MFALFLFFIEDKGAFGLAVYVYAIVGVDVDVDVDVLFSSSAILLITNYMIPFY